jgi:hypothetical protein
MPAAAAPGVALTIFADGRVVAEVPDGTRSPAAADLTRHEAEVRTLRAGARKSEVLRGRLRPAELEGLLRFALNDQEFMDFDPDTVKAAIWERYRKGANVEDPMDDTTTAYWIRTADASHEVTWSRVSKSAWDFPDVRSLLQLYALDQRLQQVVYVLIAGGPERVETILEKANELAQPYYRQYPALPRLTAADLFCVTRSADGSGMQVMFARNRADGQVRSTVFEVCVDVPQNGEPTLSYVKPPARPGSEFRGLRKE